MGNYVVNHRKRVPVYLDTLAQLSESAPNKAGGGAVSMVNAKIYHANKGKDSTLLKRAKSKYVTDAIAFRLANLKSDLHDAYERTLYCSGFMLQEGKKLTSKYCNGRWCLTCNRIRTAKLMNGYLPQIETFQDKHFLTLTVPNCSELELRSEIKRMYHAMRKIFKKLSGWKIKIRGVRKLECTYNEETGLYHPHFHLIVEGGERSATYILALWLSLFPEASEQAQDQRPADMNSIKELFKYSTKLVVKSKHKKGNVILEKPLDVIFTAMKGLRTFQAMGVKKISEDVEEIEAQVYQELQVKGDTIQLWRWYGNDWYCHDTGEILTGHKPTLNTFSLANNKYKPFKPPEKPPDRYFPLSEEKKAVIDFKEMEIKFLKP